MFVSGHVKENIVVLYICIYIKKKTIIVTITSYIRLSYKIYLQDTIAIVIVKCSSYKTINSFP